MAYDELTLKQIALLVGHDNTDAVRMALRRAGVGPSGVTLPLDGGSGWPPRQLFRANEVWNWFGRRILRNAQSSPEAKEFCWDVYGRMFGASLWSTPEAETARAIFADRLSESS